MLHTYPSTNDSVIDTRSSLSLLSILHSVLCVPKRSAFSVFLCLALFLTLLACLVQQRSAPRKINSDMKGVLVVDLMRCMDLPVVSSSCDSYVEMKLTDPDAKQPDVRKSEVVLNEPSPRYRQKFEFVSISATSMLTVTVSDTNCCALCCSLQLAGLMNVEHR